MSGCLLVFSWKRRGPGRVRTTTDWDRVIKMKLFLINIAKTQSFFTYSARMRGVINAGRLEKIEWVRWLEGRVEVCCGGMYGWSWKIQSIESKSRYRRPDNHFRDQTEERFMFRYFLLTFFFVCPFSSSILLHPQSLLCPYPYHHHRHLIIILPNSKEIKKNS